MLLISINGSHRLYRLFLKGIKLWLRAVKKGLTQWEKKHYLSLVRRRHRVDDLDHFRHLLHQRLQRQDLQQRRVRKADGLLKSQTLLSLDQVLTVYF